MIFNIKALDTLFFRDGKPFSMGDDSFAQDIFPPPPSVIYGALRSAYFANSMQDFSLLKEKKGDSSLTIEINGLAYLQEETFWSDNDKDKMTQILFPAPADLVRIKSKRKKEEKIIVSNQLLTKNDHYFSNSPLPSIVHYTKKVEGVENALLEKEQLQLYLDGSQISFDSIENISSFIVPEYKVGNALENSTRTTEDGKLYQLKMNRLEKRHKDKTGIGKTRTLSLLIDTNFKPVHEKDFLLKLGAEGKGAKVSIFTESLHIDAPSTITAKKDTFFKLYFATPVIFEKNGWFPDSLDNTTFKGIWNGIKLELISAFVGKYIPIGGFDINENRPKNMYRSVPAGSVYYFKLGKDTNPEALLDAFHNKRVSTIGQKEGFGLSFVGHLNPGEND